MFKEYRDCRYSQTNSCNSEVLFEQIVKTLTKEMNAAEAQLFSTFLLKVISGQNIVTKEEGNQITVSHFFLNILLIVVCSLNVQELLIIFYFLLKTSDETFHICLS